jgi:hypothetical protein
LFISCREPRQSLDFQGFGWNAQKKSKVAIPYESTTYTRYGVCSGPDGIFFLVPSRITFFVHKLALARLRGRKNVVGGAAFYGCRDL